MDLTFQVPMQLLFTALEFTSITSHIHNWVLFCFGSVSIISGVISPLFAILENIPAYCAPTNLGSSSFSVLSFAFSYCSQGSQGKNIEMVCHSILQWTTFCQNSPPSCLSWVALHGMVHSFIELDKAVVHVIRLVSFL